MTESYHTQGQFDARMKSRRESPRPPLPFSAWYHVACMGNWLEVFAEQVAAFASANILPSACVLGTDEDAEYVRSFFPVAYVGRDLNEYETPTLQRLWEWCCQNPSGSVLYVHTKGVSAPEDANKAAWRMLMTRHVVEAWKENLRRLEVADMIGIDWQDSPNYPHFSGNFWMARADWIINLPSPQDFRDGGGPWIAGQPWDRMHAEMWLGSKPWHHIDNLCCRNENLWSGNRVFQLLAY